MKKTYCLLFATITSFTLYAQTSSIITSEKLEKTDFIRDIQVEENELLIFSSSAIYGTTQPPTCYITKLKTNDLKIIGSPEAITQYKPKTANQVSHELYSFDNLIAINNTQFISYFPYKQTNPFSLTYQLIDKNGKIERKDDIKLDKIDKIEQRSMGITVPYNGVSRRFILSQDKKSLILTYNQIFDAAGKFKTKHTHTIVTFDAETLAKKSEILYNLDNVYDFGDKSLVGKNNMLYFLVKVFSDYESNNYEKSKWYYKLIGINTAQKSKDVEFDFDLGSKAITDMNFDIAENGDIICAGLYSEVNQKGVAESAHGFFSKRIDSNSLKIIWENETKFNPEIITTTSNKNNADKNIGTSRYFRVLDFAYLQNGTVSVIMEDRFPHKEGDRYKAILVSNITQQGNINWVRAIPKMQNFTPFYLYKDHTISYSMKVIGNKTQLFFTDISKNYDKISFMHLGKESAGIDNIKLSELTDNTLAMAEIDDNGNIIQKMVVTGKGISFWSQSIKWSADNQYIYVISHNGKNNNCITKIKP